ncbi:hypothetical protein F4561_004939 [Lipingzhangella halophila]|uniref:Uncharacterized protein n=1 Tax=Lipingzhangella halophila TaxID=1783352 RepID=A0A7W7RLD7_9ACTN|nr:hypothetical protein [Lipingzhangella halophila]
MDDPRREFIALLAAVIYPAGVQFLKRLRTRLKMRDPLLKATRQETKSDTDPPDQSA